MKTYLLGIIGCMVLTIRLLQHLVATMADVRDDYHDSQFRSPISTLDDWPEEVTAGDGENVRRLMTPTTPNIHAWRTTYQNEQRTVALQPAYTVPPHHVLKQEP